MIQIKEKKCRGSGKAKGYGCGTMQLKRTYGLGHSCGCYQKWLLNSEEGKEVISRTRLKSSKKVDKEKKKEVIARKKQTINYAGKLQSKVQQIARLIDLGHPCLARGKMALTYDGGHVFGKGSHTECKYNLHNIFAQDSRSNQSTKEDQLMTEGLRREFGEEYYKFVEGLKNKPITKHSRPDIEKMYRRACKISNDLIIAGKTYSKHERIELRNQFNIEIGFYPEELCKFESHEKAH